MSEFDSRVWIKTDRPMEWLTLARPLPTMELMSVKGSTRLWTEVHTQVCLALITPGQVGVETRWRTRARTLTTGQAGMMLIEPGEVHVTQAVSKAADFEVVRFVPAVFEEARRELGLRGDFHFRAPTGDNPKVTRAVAELGKAHARGDSNLELASLSTELVSLILSELSEQPSNVGIALDPVRDFRLRQAREYLRSQLDDKPSLDELAAELKISKYRLCAIFKAAYGVSVGQYWMAARMAEASRSLLLGVPIKHVAAQLGFVDEAFFTRVFRRHRGLPPAAWVRLQRQNSPRAPGQPLRSETRGAA